MADYTQDLSDKFYYRNKKTLRAVSLNSPYRTVRHYNACSQAEVNSTTLPTYNDYTYTPGTAQTTPPSSTIAPSASSSIVPSASS